MTVYYCQHVIPLKNKVGVGEFSFLESGVSPLENQYFQRFKYQKDRAGSTILLVFEALTNTFSRGLGFPLFLKTKTPPSSFFNEITISMSAVSALIVFLY